ncbi:MAG: hypothetical protein E7503_08865 [Ruminococcus sp.]|nr:hypothetical protein [Ruminococcus sp.]
MFSALCQGRETVKAKRIFRHDSQKTVPYFL